MKAQLWEKLKKEGRSLKWFHDEYCHDITYNALALQLNGYAVISDSAKAAIHKYLKDKI